MIEARKPTQAELHDLIGYILEYPKMRRYILSNTPNYDFNSLTEKFSGPLMAEQKRLVRAETLAVREALKKCSIAVFDGYCDDASRKYNQGPLPQKAMVVLYPFGRGDFGAFLWFDPEKGGFIPWVRQSDEDDKRSTQIPNVDSELIKPENPLQLNPKGKTDDTSWANKQRDSGRQKN